MRQNKNFNKIYKWLQILLPSILGIGLLSVITNILYSGGRRESLAAKTESYLIEYALKTSVQSAKNVGKVISISLSDQDLTKFKSAGYNVLKDAHIDAYAQILSTVAQHKPQLVIISWLMNAHPQDMFYLNQIFQVIDHSQDPSRYLIAFPYPYFSQVPKEYTDRYQIKDAPDCVYEINSYCTYNKEWQNWMIQAIADRLWHPPKYAVSDNLPHSLPSFIANFCDQTSIPNYSFWQVLQGQLKPEQINGAIITIGNNTSQPHQFRDHKDLLQRGYIAASKQRRSLLQDGTPYHVFWAQLAQMFIDERSVIVPPRIVTLSIIVILGVIIWFALIRIGPTASFGTYLLYSCLIPLLNGYSIKYLQFYLPMFDLIYSGLLTFIVAAFTFMSSNTFNKWRFITRQNIFQSTADLKGNFISLISHNLNTPIAKLSGLLDLLKKSKDFNGPKQFLDQCQYLISKMQMCIKSVLLSTTLEQQDLNLTQTTVKQILDEFVSIYALTIEKLQVSYSFEPSLKQQDPEILYTMINTDKKFVIHALAGLLTLFIPHHHGTAAVIFTKNELSKQVTVTLRFNKHPSWQTFFTDIQAINESQPQLTASVHEFYFDLVCNYLRILTQTLKYQLIAKEDESHYYFSLKLPAL